MAKYCDNPDCDCDHKHHHHHQESRGGAGFALGVAIGAVMAVLMAPGEGKKMRGKAKKKLDELTGGKTPEELVESLKNVVGAVIDDLQDSAEEGVAEAKRTKKDVLAGKRTVGKAPRRKKK